MRLSGILGDGDVHDDDADNDVVDDRDDDNLSKLKIFGNKLLMISNNKDFLFQDKHGDKQLQEQRRDSR